MTSASRTTQSNLTPLSWQMRGELFAQLAAMEKAGLPVMQALEVLRFPAEPQARVAMTRKLLARGTELSLAGRRSGLFTDLEANLISAATSAGSPAQTYRRLGDYYTQRAMQARAMKSRMALPAFMLVASLFVQPLPQLFTGTLSLGRYLWHCLVPLVVIAGLILLLKQILRVQEGPSSALRVAIESLVTRLPLFGKMLIRRSIRDFFESLALMVEAGMPILQALPKAIDTMQLTDVKAPFRGIRARIERGGTLTQALADIPYLDNGQALALINTGEASGTLPEMLFRYAAMETDAINHFNQQLAEWLPRIIYAGVAGWMAYGILTGAGVGPDLPPELR